MTSYIGNDCGSEELREFLSLIDNSNLDARIVGAARFAFKKYQGSIFNDELRECHSREQFDGLVDDLEIISDRLNVDIEFLLTKVEEEREEFEANAEEYADQMEDEWKEHWREERATDRSISEMFGSLRSSRE